MKKGGYKIIDLKGLDLKFNGGDFDDSSIYTSLITSHLKVLLITGLLLDGVKLNDVFTTPTYSDGEVSFIVYNKLITITSTDFAVNDAKLGGTQLYKHTLYIKDDDQFDGIIQLIGTSKTPITSISSLYQSINGGEVSLVGRYTQNNGSQDFYFTPVYFDIYQSSASEVLMMYKGEQDSLNGCSILTIENDLVLAL